MKRRMATLDFETEKIEKRPRHPPKPVGVSIHIWGQKQTKYYAWGHPMENNCTFEQARDRVVELFRGDYDILGHNLKFDYEVALEYMGAPVVEWHRLHDTMYQIFLLDPHADTFALKPSAHRILDIAPEEQDAVRDWLIANQQELRVAGWLDGNVKITPSNFGAYICLAPGNLVGAYANGDVYRTEKLHEHIYPILQETGMLEAYDRERKLMPILLQNERRGMLVDQDALEQDLEKYTACMETADDWLRERLGAPSLNVDSDKEMADALECAGVVTEFAVTKTGKRSTSKKNLTPDMFHDSEVASVFGYRNRLGTCLSTFMSPWLQMAYACGGRIHTNWNQVRQVGGTGSQGTRTGRLSSNPNFMNIPKDFYDKNDGYVHPAFHEGLLELPLMRKYIIAGKGHVLLNRDYNQQELRILAHFEDDKLCQAYQEDPTLDVHTFIQNEINAISPTPLERRAVKILNFGVLYGMGLAKLAESIGCTFDEAKKIKAAQRKAVPGLKALEEGIKRTAKAGEAIYTWGGRRYYPEDPVLIDGYWKTFEYKLLNYLIQGSAADCTKQSIINLHDLESRSEFVVTVHDENMIEAHAKDAKRAMTVLREAMESVVFSVPMKSDGKWGTNWAGLQKYEEK